MHEVASIIAGSTLGVIALLCLTLAICPRVHDNDFWATCGCQVFAIGRARVVGGVSVTPWYVVPVRLVIAVIRR